MFCKVAMSLTLVAFLAAPVLAQGQGQGQRRPGQGGFGGVGQLLNDKKFQEELKLSEEQITKAKEAAKTIGDKHKDDFAEIQQAPQEERMQKFMALGKTVNEETTKALADIFKPEQMKRFKQIQLQMSARSPFTNIFADADVQKSLKLTDEQKDKIKTISKDTQESIAELRKSAAGDFQALGRKMQEVRKDETEKIMAVLTDDQKKARKEMTGEPFEMTRPGGNRQPTPPAADKKDK